MINYEKNIIQILKISKTTFMPELSSWNPTGLTEEEARVISYKYNLTLKILESSFMPTLRVFKFQIKPLDHSVKQNDGEGKGKGKEKKL